MVCNIKSCYLVHSTLALVLAYTSLPLHSLLSFPPDFWKEVAINLHRKLKVVTEDRSRCYSNNNNIMWCDCRGLLTSNNKIFSIIPSCSQNDSVQLL